MKIKGFITHKLAEEYSDCQDFFAVNVDKKVVAIADGMSQSIFPQWWAEELANAYIKDDWDPMVDRSKLKDLQECWLNRVQNFLKEQQEKGEPTWMLENCLADKRGAGSTFCGVHFNGHEWNGCVLGDSCLIEVNELNNIVQICRSQEGNFGNHPDYFDSVDQGKGTPKAIQGVLKENYKLLLVSDPLAEFLFKKQNEHCEAKYIQKLLQLESHENFCGLVSDWRENERLHNDDTTLVIIEDDTKDLFQIISIDDLKKLNTNATLIKVEDITIDEETEKEEENLISIPSTIIDKVICILKNILSIKKKYRKYGYEEINSLIKTLTNYIKK